MHARHRWLMISLALAPMVVACPPPAPSPVPGPHVGLPAYPGQDTAATKAYLASLDFTQTDSIFNGAIQCHSPSDCTGDSIRLNIVPERNAHEVPVETALHAGPGYIVARIINLDNKPYASYQLAPFDTTYLWVGAMAGGARRFAIYRISAVTGAATVRSRAKKAGWCTKPPGMVRSIAAVHVNSMTECNAHTFYATLPDERNEPRLANVSNGLIGGATLNAFAHSSGLWFSCSMGCCEGSGFEAVI
jgi:hypothetical protein